MIDNNSIADINRSIRFSAREIGNYNPEVCSTENTDEENMRIIIRNIFRKDDIALYSDLDAIIKLNWLNCKRSLNRVTNTYGITQDTIDFYTELFKNCQEIYWGAQSNYNVVYEYLINNENDYGLNENEEYFDGKYKSYIISYANIGNIVLLNACNDYGDDSALYIVGIKNGSVYESKKNIRNKKALYENIMSSIAKEVKKALNESESESVTKEWYQKWIKLAAEKNSPRKWAEIGKLPNITIDWIKLAAEENSPRKWDKASQLFKKNNGK